MAHIGQVDPPPCTQATQRALQSVRDARSVADLLLLDAWLIDRSMHLGMMLRIRQINRANPGLASEIAAEVAGFRFTD